MVRFRGKVGIGGYPAVASFVLYADRNISNKWQSIQLEQVWSGPYYLLSINHGLVFDPSDVHDIIGAILEITCMDEQQRTYRGSVQLQLNPNQTSEYYNDLALYPA